MKTKILALINEGLTTYAHIGNRLNKPQETIRWHINQDPELAAAFAINRAKVRKAKDDLKAEIIERLHNGESVKGVARHYGMSSETIYRYASKRK